MKVIQPPSSISEIGTQAILEVQIFPFIKKIWKAEHIGFEKNHKFIDIQREGPFQYFCHEHRFESDGEYSVLTDHIEFDFFMNSVAKYFIFYKLKFQFLKRHEATAHYLQTDFKNLFCGLI